MRNDPPRQQSGDLRDGPRQADLRKFIRENDTAVSAISYVEALGFHGLQSAEKADLERFFASVPMLPLGLPVLQEAVRLRQQRKMSLGDSLIAATALVHQLPLATRDVRDFRWIPNLKLVNPFGSKRRGFFGVAGTQPDDPAVCAAQRSGMWERLMKSTQRAELERRLARYEHEPKAGYSWKEVREHMLAALDAVRKGDKNRPRG